jgi:hypothetical protein
MMGHGVWLYGRVCLSDRYGAELMAERGVILARCGHAVWVSNVRVN